MSDYKNLVEALRHCVSDEKGVTKCAGCPYYPDITGCMDRLHTDAAAAIEELQQIADHHEQTAKDYWKEACEYKAQLPKRGEWIEDTTTYAGPCLSNYKCSLCGKICGTWRSGLKPSELPNWCGNCGADMRNMEAQDGK